MGKDEEEKDDVVLLLLIFRCFDHHNITSMNAVPADNTEAPAKDGFQEEAADGTTGDDGLFGALATADG